MGHETTFPSEATKPVFPLGWTTLEPSGHQTVFPLGEDGLSGEGPSALPLYYTASGAGNALVNGVYAFGGYGAGGRAYYGPVNGYYIGFFITVWMIALQGGEEALQYSATDNAEIFPPESGWSVQDGAAPVPTIVAGPTS